MRPTEKLIEQLERTEAFDGKQVLDLRIAILEYINHLMRKYLDRKIKVPEVNACIDKLQEAYAKLQKMAANNNYDLQEDAFNHLKFELLNCTRKVQQIMGNGL